MESQIKLVGPEIKAKKGETVRLVAEFARVTNACVHERMEGSGYRRICYQHTAKLECDVVINEDTTDFVVTICDNDKPHLSYEGCNGQIWCPVKVVKDDVPTPEPQPKDLGKYLYSVGLLSDLHICKANTPKNENEKRDDDWGDEKDFIRCMDLFSADKNVKCVMGCGDISESYTNNDGKHPESTCDADYAEVRQILDVPYWQVQGLRFFSPLGNHDHYGLFETRKGDERDAKRKDNETIPGYNKTASERLAKLWPTDGGINGIVPGRGRIVFELEKGAKNATGQADMRFFSFNDIADLYARKGGYTGTSVWDPSRNGISTEAIKCAKSYVNSHWDECKNRLTMWDDGGGHGRNGYSKLSYWLKKDKDIFVFLSLYYGDDVWPIDDKWHDRMVHARTIIDTKSDDPYIKRMVEFVQGTGYDDADRLYDYMYYHPNSLIWLKELIENNPDCKIMIFTHHFLPNRVGNGVGLPIKGNWFYSNVHPSDEKDPKEGNIYPVGSNALTGIEFYFISKLLDTYKNVIMFSGHSHISWTSGANFDNHGYPFISPKNKDKYVYTKASETPDVTSGWTVALPSMSKPVQIVNGQAVKRYQDAEMGVLEIYERGVKIKGYRVKKDNQDVNELLVEKDIKLI